MAPATFSRSRNILNFFRSIQFRLVALSISISAVTLIALTVFLYDGIKQTQSAAFDSSLHNHAVDIANGTDLNALGDLIVKRDALVDAHKVFPFPLGASIVQIRTLDGTFILSSVRLSSLRLPLTPLAAEQTSKFGSRIETIRVGEVAYRLIDYLTNRPDLPPLILQVAVPLTMIEVERRQILSLLWTLIPLALLASAGGGLLVARRALNPVRRIIRSAREIEPQELSARVPVPRETEMKQLALTLNELLARLQKAFVSQEQFIADASHQLKTPLAIVRGEIDVFRASRVGQPPEVAAPLLDSISQEVNHLAKMVDDLLLLARFDSGTLTPDFSRVRLDEVVMEAASQTRKLATEKGIEIHFDVAAEALESSDLEVKGDANLLRALFFNLLENSIKYSARGARTAVEISSDAEALIVRITDQGKGIAQDELTRIFDRFHRSGDMQHLVPGVGLGLSIASRIANFHSATLMVTSQLARGTEFTFRIKKF